MTDLGHFGGRSDDPDRRKPRLQRRNAADMVGMMMGDQDIGEFPTGGLQRADHRRGVGSIDCGRGACRGIVDQHAVVVAEAGGTDGNAPSWYVLDRNRRFDAVACHAMSTLVQLKGKLDPDRDPSTVGGPTTRRCRNGPPPLRASVMLQQPLQIVLLFLGARRVTEAAAQLFQHLLSPGREPLPQFEVATRRSVGRPRAAQRVRIHSGPVARAIVLAFAPLRCPVDPRRRPVVPGPSAWPGPARPAEGRGAPSPGLRRRDLCRPSLRQAASSASFMACPAASKPFSPSRPMSRICFCNCPSFCRSVFWRP